MTDDGLGLRNGALALSAPDPRWARAFSVVSHRLREILPHGVEVHHIGSTAVPGLAAKAILDLGLAAPQDQHDTISEALVADGWIARGPRSGLLFIRLRDGDLRTHNLHLYPIGSTELSDQIVFRNRLRASASLREAYAADKRAIIAAGTARKDYAEAKTAFVKGAIA